MIIVQRIAGQVVEAGNVIGGRLTVETEAFETWGDAFLYLERKIGPLDHETRFQAKFTGKFESGPQDEGLALREGDRPCPVTYQAKWVEDRKEFSAEAQ